MLLIRKLSPDRLHDLAKYCRALAEVRLMSDKPVPNSLDLGLKTGFGGSPSARSFFLRGCAAGLPWFDRSRITVIIMKIL